MTKKKLTLKEAQKTNKLDKFIEEHEGNEYNLILKQLSNTSTPTLFHVEQCKKQTKTELKHFSPSP